MEVAYDPNADLNLESWSSLEEEERVYLVLEYHENTPSAVSNPRLHAAIHVVVENQVTLGVETPVARHLDRLIAEGLDRHEAVHAIGSLLAKNVAAMMMDPDWESDGKTPYYEGLNELTAAGWMNQELD